MNAWKELPPPGAAITGNPRMTVLREFARCFKRQDEQKTRPAWCVLRDDIKVTPVPLDRFREEELLARTNLILMVEFAGSLNEVTGKEAEEYFCFPGRIPGLGDEYLFDESMSWCLVFTHEDVILELRTGEHID